jgi:RNA polymerase sigma factor (TIGR02999 family)
MSTTSRKSRVPAEAEELLPLVYDELHRIAAARLRSESASNSMQATALVHEAYLRVVGLDPHQQWNGRGHFFAAAAQAMRRILIDHARRRARLRHGGQWQRVDFNAIELALNTPAEELLQLDESLARLEQAFPEAAALVSLRFFAGLKLGQAAEALGISRSTANRTWAFARAWLYDDLRGSTAGPELSADSSGG